MLTLSPELSLHSIAALPQDLQLDVCELLTDPHDKASICLADPRLGFAALRELPSFQTPLTSVALAIKLRGAKAVIDEALLRRYAADRRATADGAAWLEAAAERDGWPMYLTVKKSPMFFNKYASVWYLHRNGEPAIDAIEVRIDYPDHVRDHMGHIVSSPILCFRLLDEL